MDLRAVAKKALGYNNLLKIKKIIAVKRWLSAKKNNNLNTFSYDESYFDDCVEIKVKDKNVFFGYYDLKQLSENGEIALIHIVNKNANPKTDLAQLATYNMSNGKLEIFSETKAWSWQQGARLRWHPVLADCVLYNDYDGEKYVTRLFDVSQDKIIETIPAALYDISSNGEYGLSLDFARLQRLRPGYGYSCYEDVTIDEKIPKNWIYLWKKGETDLKPIVSLSDLVGADDLRADHYFNHISIAPSGTKFLFFHLWTFGLSTRWKNKLYVCNIDGTNLRCIDDTEIVSHYCWYGDDILLTTALANENTKHAKYVLYDLVKEEKKIIDGSFIRKDGHPTFLENGYDFVSDTYQQKNGLQYIFLSNLHGEKYQRLFSAYANPFMIDEHRCDLHPRVHIDKGWISADTTYTGLRSVVMLHMKN